jgi:hypothetical protein
MKGKTECLFVGGPKADVSLALPSMYCVDKLSLEQEGWFQATAEGGVNVMRGPRPPGADWECFSRALYLKDATVEGKGVTYRFQGIEMVDRCKHILLAKNRRCKNEATHEREFCRQHSKEAKSPSATNE